ncbi:MAG: hypothetical protein A3H96_03940 [Acidobacteria bacterium RIFCSPLOWO2_02_FULL_67_36]|nr:MAG: hypothetical protein A3H96_03940 [Acidobacteria bacterium RIFCSPLOWO2_02_FULL_67_36]
MRYPILGLQMKRVPQLIAAAELPIILAISPALLFPTPRRLLVLLVVPVVWACARRANGTLVPRTAMNLAVWLLLATVGVSLFTTVDVLFSLNKVASVVLGALLFWAITRWMTTSDQLRYGTTAFLLAGAGLALVALLGTDWKSRSATVDAVIAVLPEAIRGLPGAEKGFNPNPVAGCLLLFIPLQVALLVVGSRRALVTTSNGRNPGAWLIAIQVMSLILTASAFVLMQSRGAWAGLSVTAAAFLCWHGRRTRMLALVGAMAVVVVASTLGPEKVLSLAVNPSARGMAGGVAERIELWSNALTAIQDVPLTGMGMNAFRRVMPVIYPTVLGTSLDTAHAHNQLLQTALDVGLAGLVAYLSVWLSAAALLVRVYRRTGNAVYRATAGGLGAGLIAHFAFGATDAVALGTKAGVLFWLTLALAVGLDRVSLRD